MSCACSCRTDPTVMNLIGQGLEKGKSSDED